MRSLLQGPLPLITLLNSFQSGVPKSYPFLDSFHFRSLSGTRRPIISACGTVILTKRWRNWSLLSRFIFHLIALAEFGDSASGGPNIISVGHHQRSSASCAICFCAG